MAEQNDPAEAPSASIDRIEAALDRIAARPPAASPPGTSNDPAMIAARLDGLITRLRDALAIATA